MLCSAVSKLKKEFFFNGIALMKNSAEMLAKTVSTNLKKSELTTVVCGLIHFDLTAS
jgi:NAD(P)H-hydrate repair Nnr-like enzyme with NAD(P)H-hydrate epimerase domain